MSLLEEPRPTIPPPATTSRMVVVSRRFWPHCDDACLRLLTMIDGLRERNIHCQVLTGRWHHSWPESAVLRDTPVTRLLPPPSGHWNEAHFQKNTLAWLARHAESYDAIYVDRADSLLSAIASRAHRWNKPVIARFAPEAVAEGNRVAWNVSAAVNACRRCHSIVTPNPASHRQLLAHGIDPRRIVRVADFLDRYAERTPRARSEAGAALFQVSSDFVIPGRTDLILHVGMAEPKSLMQAIRAVCDLLDSGSSLRMWIVGSDAPLATLHQTIKDRGWHREILLFDGFDDLEELMTLADLAIVTNPETALQFSALMLVNSDVPMMMADTPESRAWCPDMPLMKRFRDGDELLRQLQDWLMHREQWVTEAVALRHQMQRQRTSQESLDAWESIVKPLAIEFRG